MHPAEWQETRNKPAHFYAFFTLARGMPVNFLFKNRKHVSVNCADATNITLPPYTGAQYARLANIPLEFVVTGKVPVGERKVAIKNSGFTILSSYYSVSQTLSSLGLENISG